jgi:hypothetical protein
MKMHRVVCCCLSLAIPPLASADLPFSSETFGRLEGMLSFCSQVNPRAADQYQATAKLLVKNVRPKEISKARASQDYRDAYDSIGAELGKVAKEDALKACSGAVESSR